MEMYDKLKALPKSIVRQENEWYLSMNFIEDVCSLEYVCYFPELEAECRTCGWNGEMDECIEKAYEHFKTTGELL